MARIRWYDDRDAKRNGEEDASQCIPAWDAEFFPPYIMQLHQTGEEEIDRLERKFEHSDRKLKPRYCRAVSVRDSSEQRVEASQGEYNDAVDQYRERHGELPVGKRGTSIWWYRLFITFLFLSELPMNAVVFRTFDEPEWLTILMTLLVAGILIGCAHFLGVFLREGTLSDKTSIALTVLVVLLPISVMCGVAYMRESYLAAIQTGLKEIGEDSVQLGNAQLFWTFLAINAVVYLVASVASYFAHDPVSRTSYSLHRAIRQRDAAKHRLEGTSGRRYAVAKEFGRRMTEIKNKAECLMNVYQTHNLRKRDHKAEKEACGRPDLKMPLCFSSYTGIGVDECFIDPSKLDWDCAHNAYGSGGTA